MKNKYFKAILDNSPESIVLIDKNHRVLAFNQVIQDVLLKYHNKIIKENDFYYPDYVIEPNRSVYLEAFHAAINGQPFNVQLLTENESVSLWFDYTMSPVYDGDELLGVTLSAKDITAQKTAELKLTDLSKKFKAVLDNTDESITLLGLDYKILALNRLSEAAIAHNTSVQAPYVGKDFRDFISSETNAFYACFPRAAAGETVTTEISYQTHAGDWLWYQTRFNPVYDEAQQLMGVSIFAKDVTAQKKLEMSLNSMFIAFA